MKNADMDTRFIAEALPAFISEAREQIEAIEQLMLQLEDAPDDRELLDALFRCAHTVKGSAGIFGLDAVVGFTHHVETLLDRLRDGKLALTPELSTLLLQCNDQIRLLVDAALAPQADDGQALAHRAALVERLQAASGDLAPATAAVPGPPAPADALPRWHVSVQFGSETFRNGMDPLAILGYVAGLGAIPRCVCDLAAVPALEAIDPESCHLAFEFSLDSAASRAQIEAAFSFVRDDCVLHLIDPAASPDEFAALIGALPDSPRLGDMLLAVGAISAGQLARALGRETRDIFLAIKQQECARFAAQVTELDYAWYLRSV